APVCGLFRLLDQRLASEMRVNLVVGSGGRVSGTVFDGEGEIDLGHVGTTYVRPLVTALACGTEATDAPAYVRTVGAHRTGIACAAISPTVALTRPAVTAANISKPYQLALIAGYGFAVPDTLVTTDERAARRFHECHGSVIYKSVSGVRS